MSGVYTQFPEIRTHMRRSCAIGRSQGYVEDIFGRKRFLPDLTSRDPNRRERAELQATNAPIQMSGASILKLAIIGTKRMIDQCGFHAHPLLSVHDEVLVECLDEEVTEFSTRFKEVMEGVTTLSVPLEAEVHCGKSWSECK